MNREITLKTFILPESFLLESYNIFKERTNLISNIGLEAFCYVVANDPYVMKELLLCYGTNNSRDALKIITTLEPSKEFKNAFDNACPEQKQSFGHIEIEIRPNDCRQILELLHETGLSVIANVLTLKAISEVLHFQPWILSDLKTNNFKTRQEALFFADWCFDCIVGKKAEGKNLNEMVKILEKEVKINYNNIQLIK